MSTVKKIYDACCIFIVFIFIFHCLSFVVVIRILNENKTLTDNLEERESEIQQLRAENSGE